MSDSDPDIRHEELRRRLDGPELLLVNVLPLAAFLEARIPGSHSLPVAEIEARAAGEIPREGREIVVYCGGPT